ncbi:hypothetical protein FDP41_004214 [Naegleria fowleri]|uniref:GTP-eEF1A C-terminal domain-containing protein n=1 Tax=Naegleria fowleri TaxID=5763 RepID=A0A6A5BVF4_NAEFO|nr:uncharacterized protein FDP41_004214 [Naegleria fowleri]KAF0976919.1 hypothetical protein FDP41_004214 [Naegleria fowleri]
MLSRLFGFNKKINNNNSSDDTSSQHNKNTNKTLKNPFPFPKEIILKISQFLFLPDLFHFGMSCPFTLKILFNQTPQLVMHRLKEKEQRKSKKSNMSLVLQQDAIIEIYKKQEEEQLQPQNDDTFMNFEIVQNMIWKNLVNYYFIRFCASGVKNWMHVLRRRITYLMVHDPKKLPLVTSFHRSEFEAMINDPYQFKLLSPCSSDLEFIEKCDNLYKCPMHLSSIETKSYHSSKYCQECNHTITLTNTYDNFLTSVLTDPLTAITLQVNNQPRAPPAKNSVKFKVQAKTSLIIEDHHHHHSIDPITLVLLGPLSSGKTEALKIIQYYNSRDQFRTSSSTDSSSSNHSNLNLFNHKREIPNIIRYDQWSGESYRNKELYYSRLRESYDEPTIDMNCLIYAYLPPKGEQVLQLADIGGDEKLMKNASSGISLSENSAALIVVGVDSICHSKVLQKVLHDHLMLARVEESFMEVKKQILELGLKNILRIDHWSNHWSKVPIIPTSLVMEENVMRNSEKMPWYKGDTLLSFIDSLTPPSCEEWKKYAPLRFSVIHPFKIGGIGTVLFGKLHSGILQEGALVNVATVGGTYISNVQVRTIEIDGRRVKKAFPGSLVAVNVCKLTLRDCRRGLVISTPDNPATFTTNFEAKIKILECPNIIKEGFTPMVDCGLAHVACRFEKLCYTIDASTGRVLSSHPSSLKKNDLAIVKLRTTNHRFLLERYNDFPFCGRIIIRDNDKIIAVGTVTKIVRP